MSEELCIIKGSKLQQYKNLFPQLQALKNSCDDLIANMANFSAALRQQFQWFWVGFYLVKGSELIVGPFQGPIACMRIANGQGVCGICWEQEKPIIVSDVNQFDGHIACNADSKSEIVIPVFQSGRMIAVLDVDSDRLNAFDDTDAEWLMKIGALLS